MIQFNLLPDVKLEYIRARRTKRSILIGSVLASGVALFILISLFFVVHGLQKKHLSDLDKDIASMTKELKEKPDLSKVLTVQNQLNNLTQLHDTKPVTGRLFGYLGQITPTPISIAKLEVSFTDSNFIITGAADSLSTINTFIDTLKFTDYTYKENEVDQTKRAFSEVVLTTFGRDDKGASYVINLKFDPAIFDVNKQVTLVVPKGKITTRSETEKPIDLFQPNVDSTRRQ
jgi:hypothetical protein